MADEPAAPVEPAGEPAASPYAEYLERIPEELRGQVEPVFKDWDAGVTKRFQDASEYRKQWEPYEKLNVHQMDPAHVQWAQEFIAAQQSNPQAIAAWYEEFAKTNGLTEDPAANLGDPDLAAQLQAMIEQALTPVTQTLGGLTAWQQQQEAQRAEQAAMQAIEEQFKALPEGTPRAQVEMFLPRHMSDPANAVKLAHADYTAMVASVEKQMVAQKLGQPPAPNGGGTANTALEPIKSLDAAAALAKERIEAMNLAR